MSKEIKTMGATYELVETHSNIVEYKLSAKESTTYIILEQEKNTALLKRIIAENGSDPTPYIVASGINFKENNLIEWDSGAYCSNILSAVNEYSQHTLTLYNEHSPSETTLILSMLNSGVSEEDTELAMQAIRKLRQDNNVFKPDNITIEGHTGTWYVVDTKEYQGEMLYLLESEIYGDEAACLIVNANKEVMLDDVWNGFDDYDYALLDVEEFIADNNNTPDFNENIDIDEAYQSFNSEKFSLFSIEIHGERFNYLSKDIAQPTDLLQKYNLCNGKINVLSENCEQISEVKYAELSQASPNCIFEATLNVDENKFEAWHIGKLIKKPLDEAVKTLGKSLSEKLEKPIYNQEYDMTIDTFRGYANSMMYPDPTSVVMSDKVEAIATKAVNDGLDIYKVFSALRIEGYDYDENGREYIKFHGEETAKTIIEKLQEKSFAQEDKKVSLQAKLDSCKKSCDKVNSTHTISVKNKTEMEL